MNGRALSRAVFALVCTAAAVAQACPYCAGRDGDGAFGSLALLGAVIAAPFAIGGCVAWAIRRVAADDVPEELVHGEEANTRHVISERDAAVELQLRAGNSQRDDAHAVDPDSRARDLAVRTVPPDATGSTR